MPDKFDELLYSAAQKKTEELNLNGLLPGIKSNAKKNVVLPFKKRGSALAIAASFAVTAAVLVLILGRTVEVEGKTYVMIGGSVSIDGETYSVNKPNSEQTRLVQIEGNKYAILSPGTSDILAQVVVFPPDTHEQNIENENAIRGNEDVYSIDPVVVYPIVGDLVVRAAPDASSEEISILHAGQCVVKIGMSKNWAVIEWDDQIAYVFDLYLFEAPDEMPMYSPVDKYATEELNVRSLPTSREESEVIGELKKDEQVQCTGVIGAWSQIEYNGNKAYVFSKYLRD